MSKKSEAIKRWRRRAKGRAVESMGGKCCICGYNKSKSALEFHHLNPDEKEHGLANILAKLGSWKKVVVELRKSVLICSNCHKEIHDKSCDTQLPVNAPRFNEEFAEYRIPKEMDICPVCHGPKPKEQITCSKQCAGSLARKVDWDNIDVAALYREHGSFEKVGELLGVSGAAVNKQYRKRIQKCCG